MIGFDRPLRPRWIYETLLMAEPGQKLSELNLPFEQVARELTGKEGKRKVRTVLFRYFLRDEQKQTRVREQLPLKALTEELGFDFMRPIYLFYLVGSADTLFKISEHLFRLYGYGSKVNPVFLQQKMAGSFGDRDVVLRAARSFLQTLAHFGIIESQDGAGLSLKKPLSVNEEQLRVMLQLYAKEILHSPQISLHQLNSPLFQFFALPDPKPVAQKYNGRHWDYQHRMREDFIIVY
jgi:hypothetical protein